ncbi:hypothetical protein ASPCADRAFT_128496 [Aspergillus carbonarius ITEM 5010]|uniref:Tat pathway signal sequence n=1 Tax=Aspergillus carbonarius (strain ITEM 5010) TaxID=602072 RepID=A0A1R3RV49_ASPC5|nr:hypothetical protein ASPCADRAFT_128496 [Aspergillus carbonarius ITEM 5010]
MSDRGGYSRLSSDPEGSEQGKLAPLEFIRRIANGLLSGSVGLLVGLAIGILYGHFVWPRSEPTVPNTVARVPLTRWVSQHVHRDSRFEAPPEPDIVQEPPWDSLLPKGLGYVRHPELAPQISVLGVFHSLHCLYMIRRGYYAANQTSHMAFDLGLDRESHVGHCFDYLRQSLVCSADSNLQPANRRVFEDADWGFDRQCRDIEELRTWAEEWRVWDMNGTFIPSTFIQEDK